MLQRGDSSTAGVGARIRLRFLRLLDLRRRRRAASVRVVCRALPGLRETAFRDRASYFRRYADLSEEEARQVATRIWNEINAVNLRANIAPTRGRARLILEKGGNHLVQSVRLRKL